MRRELNEIEYMTWILGQQYNLVNWISVRGDVNLARFQEAVDRARQRHPLLQATIIKGPNGLPWLDSDRVTKIIVTVEDRRDDFHPFTVVEQELAKKFDMFDPSSNDSGRESLKIELPCLARITLLRDRKVTDIIFCVQHVIADGLSMSILIRDILQFYDNPEMELVVIDALVMDDDIIPPGIHKHIPRNVNKMKFIYGLLRIIHFIKFHGRQPGDYCITNNENREFKMNSYALTVEETSQFISRCRDEGVTVQVAICTACSPSFPVINSPINLRSMLARPIGEAFGLAAGGTIVKMRYNEKKSFWDNARAFSRMFQHKIVPSKIFQFSSIISKAVPISLTRKILLLMIDELATNRAFVITNYGSLDNLGIPFDVGNLHIESYVCSVSNPIGAIILLIYTIAGSMHFRVHYSECTDAAIEVEHQISNAIERLRSAFA